MILDLVNIRVIAGIHLDADKEVGDTRNECQH
jgi:hypothetical protein